MGNPLGPVIANIFMVDELENTEVPKIGAWTARYLSLKTPILRYPEQPPQ